MSSNRIGLIFLGIIFLVIIALSSSRILNSIRTKTGLISQKEQIKNISLTTTPEPDNTEKKDANSTFAGKEIPATGPPSLLYLFLGAGVFSGIAIKRIKG